MSDIHVVVLAAGKGTRMKSARPKVLHPAAGLPLIDHVLRAASALSPSSIVLVVGHQAGQLKDALHIRPGLSFASQEPQLGTGHALLQAEPLLRGASGTLERFVRIPYALPEEQLSEAIELLSRAWHSITGSGAPEPTAVVV